MPSKLVANPRAKRERPKTKVNTSNFSFENKRSRVLFLASLPRGAPRPYQYYQMHHPRGANRTPKKNTLRKNSSSPHPLRAQKIGACVGPRGGSKSKVKRKRTRPLTCGREMGSSFWLVSLPLEGGSADRTWSILQDKTTHGGGCSPSFPL